MGNSTRLYGKNIVSIETLKNIIDKEFNCDSQVRNVDDGVGVWHKIQFRYDVDEEYRDLAYFPNSTDLEYWGTDDQTVGPKHFVLTFGMWGHSVDILKRIGAEIGGWLDENDCDDELDVYINPIKKIRRERLNQILTQ
jgi:hypothetical protein